MDFIKDEYIISLESTCVWECKLFILQTGEEICLEQSGQIDRMFMRVFMYNKSRNPKNHYSENINNHIEYTDINWNILFIYLFISLFKLWKFSSIRKKENCDKIHQSDYSHCFQFSLCNFYVLCYVCMTCMNIFFIFFILLTLIVLLKLQCCWARLCIQSSSYKNISLFLSFTPFFCMWLHILYECICQTTLLFDHHHIYNNKNYVVNEKNVYVLIEKERKNMKWKKER